MTNPYETKLIRSIIRARLARLTQQTAHFRAAYRQKNIPATRTIIWQMLSTLKSIEAQLTALSLGQTHKHNPPPSQ